MNSTTTIALLFAIFRYLLFAAGAFLIKQGIVEQTVFEAWANEAALAIGGGVIVLLTILWRWATIKFQELALVKAVQHPAPSVSPDAPFTPQIVRTVEEVKEEAANESRVPNALLH